MKQRPMTPEEAQRFAAKYGMQTGEAPKLTPERLLAKHTSTPRPRPKPPHTKDHGIPAWVQRRAQRRVAA